MMIAEAEAPPFITERGGSFYRDAYKTGAIIRSVAFGCSIATTPHGGALRMRV